MTSTLITLAFAYAVVLLITVSLWLHTRHSVWVKSTVVVLVFAFCVASYEGWRRVTGWPTPEVIPERFLLLSSWVR
ncbi:MAG: hypothetical protein AAFX85_16700, partial [Pseudomonadota bacterium]